MIHDIVLIIIWFIFFINSLILLVKLIRLRNEIRNSLAEIDIDKGKK